MYVLINSTGTAPPIALSSLSVNPSSVAGGSSSTGRVILTRTVQTGTAVGLASSSTAATVPASVTVPAGMSSANFMVNTTQISSQTTATITASLNNTSRSANLTISGALDRISITRAEYDSSKRTLRVEATCTRSIATLQVFVTSGGALIGTLRNNGGGKYGGEFSVTANPQSISVRSNSGGLATSAVAVK
jgi:hypothetical protein